MSFVAVGTPRIAEFPESVELFTSVCDADDLQLKDRQLEKSIKLIRMLFQLSVKCGQHEQSVFD
jgi:hypothetical protein